MSVLTEEGKLEFQSEGARYAYADSITNAYISAQIRKLRDDRKFNQSELASLIGTKQSGISRLERADYSAWKIGTLRKLARAFHVRLRISFEGFGSIPEDLKRFTENDLAPPRYEDDSILLVPDGGRLPGADDSRGPGPEIDDRLAEGETMEREQVIETHGFTDLAGFLEWANELATRSGSRGAVLLEDGGTCDITRAYVISRRLSDGSEVWNLRLSS